MQINVVATCLGNANFDMVGQFKGYNVHSVPVRISMGLAARLHRYALNRLKESGFHIPQTWRVEVEAMEYPGNIPSEWTYHVTYTNPEGGQMGVQGIFIDRYGWPCGDHRFFIEER